MHHLEQRLVLVGSIRPPEYWQPSAETCGRFILAMNCTLLSVLFCSCLLTNLFPTHLVTHGRLLSALFQFLHETYNNNASSMQNVVTGRLQQPGRIYRKSYIRAHERHTLFLTQCGRLTQICVYALQLWKTDDKHLRF